MNERIQAKVINKVIRYSLKWGAEVAEMGAPVEAGVQVKPEVESGKNVDVKM